MMPAESDRQPPQPGRRAWVARQAGLVALFVAAALLGTLSGVLFAYADDLPEISALDDYRPNTITRLLASDGQVIGEFATERRVVIGYDDIAPALRQAIIATEDADFDQHFGLSISRMVVTLAQGRAARASAPAPARITQQLARNLFSDIGVRRRRARAQDQGGAPRDADREALHQARDLHLLRQPDLLRARRLRRRGGVAPVLRQAGEGR